MRKWILYKTEVWLNVCEGTQIVFRQIFMPEQVKKLEPGRDPEDYLIEPPHFPKAKEFWHSAPI